MALRSPVAALTASWSLVSCTRSSLSMPSSTMLPKSLFGPVTSLVPVDRLVDWVAPTCGATYGVKPAAPIPSIPAMLMSRPSDLQGGAVGLLGVLGDLHG